MSTTITWSGGSSSPLLVDGFTSTRTSQNVVHTIPGNEDADVVLRPAGLRTGSLRLLYDNATDAAAAEAAHAGARTFALASTDQPAVNMNYVVAQDGAVTLTLDDETRTLWILEVAYQEVA